MKFIKVKLPNGKIVWKRQKVYRAGPQSNPEENPIQESNPPISKSGAGEFGTNTLRRQYAKDTPGQKENYGVVEYSYPLPWENQGTEDSKSPKTFELVRKALAGLREDAPPGAKYKRMVKHIKKGYSKDGKLTDREKSIAYATAWKAKNRSKKNV